MLPVAFSAPRGGLQHHCLGFLGSPAVTFQLVFLEPGTSPHETPLPTPAVTLWQGWSAKAAPARSYQLPVGDWRICILEEALGDICVLPCTATMCF